MADTEYMSLVIKPVEKGCGWVDPDPMVDTMIVRDGQIIGQGYHKEHDALHAERNTLASCESPSAGATIYVILEPRCHYGKAPSYIDTILESGIRRVIIRFHDPNPQVSGEEIAILCSHGIEVTENRLKSECDALNQNFSHYIQRGAPHVVMKYAMTLDGKIATH